MQVRYQLLIRGIKTDADPDKPDAPPRWIFKTYPKKATARSGISIKPCKVLFKKIDLNHDRYPDRLVYNWLNRGSTGYRTEVYTFIGDRYCYPGTTRFGNAPGTLRNEYRNLQCEAKDVHLKDPF